MTGTKKVQISEENGTVPPSCIAVSTCIRCLCLSIFMTYDIYIYIFLLLFFFHEHFITFCSGGVQASSFRLI